MFSNTFQEEILNTGNIIYYRLNVYHNDLCKPSYIECKQKLEYTPTYYLMTIKSKYDYYIIGFSFFLYNFKNRKL